MLLTNVHMVYSKISIPMDNYASFLAARVPRFAFNFSPIPSIQLVGYICLWVFA